MTRLLHDLVTRQVEDRSSNTAVVMGESAVTYGQLESESNRLARLLRAEGCRQGDRVCLLLPKSPEAITSMLGVLKAGAIYVPLDTASPAPRVGKILESAEPAVVLVAPEATRLMDDLVEIGAVPSEVVVGMVGPNAPSGHRFKPAFSRADWGSFDSEPPSLAGKTDDVAHILFTSGSTGVPKGVQITHRNVLHFIDWATSYFGTRPGDRISGHPPLHFDLSTFDIYGTFLAGGELHLVPPLLNLLPPKLAEFITAAELTQWFAVPSTFAHMVTFGVVQPGAFPSLERVIWCGEVLPTPVLRAWMEAVPQAAFANLYGPTEATIASSYYTVPARPTSDNDQIPIGTPCAGEELLVLDEEMRPVPTGENGDLYIAGVGLSPGYWRDEEKTAAAFVPDPRAHEGGDGRIYRTGDLARVGEDALVYFVGRADSQIKSRGYRIELGEIEAGLNGFWELSECAVVGIATGGFEGTAVCCAYTLSPDAWIGPSEMLERLRKELPTYMLPTEWLRLDFLPKNVNGKIDRRQLREMFEQRSLARKTQALEPAVAEASAPAR